MKNILVLLIAVAAGACAPKAVIVEPFVRQTVPEKTPDASPALRDAQRAAADADAKADAARDQVGNVSREAKTLREGLQAAVVEADRLRKQKSASEAELDGMWRSLEALTVRNLFLEAEAAKAADSLMHEKALRRGASDALRAAEVAVVKKEGEATELRLQLIDSESMREASHAAHGALAKVAADQQSRADKLSGEMRVHWIGHAITGLIIIGLVLLMVIKPRFL